MVVRSIIAESVDEANCLLAKGWYLNNLDTQNSRWAGDPSRIRFMLVRLSRLGIFMPKSVNKNLLERPILFGRWASDAGSNNMPSVHKKHFGNGSFAMASGFNFFDFAKRRSIHNDVGVNGSSNSSPNDERMHLYQRGRTSITG
jgi:urocanate hydratase